jgi:2-polyprenyl-3-methyl-5-hydroxy-6-metoxy-1,4-benzoquinol methylase
MKKNATKKNSYVQMTDTVIKQFEDQVDLYSQHEVRVESQTLPFLKKYFPIFKKRQPTLTICEFGGGGGDLLKAIEGLTKRRLSLINSELVQEYKKHQATKQIKFLQRSILDSQFADNSFDIVVVRNVIHHLVNTSLPKTRDNQRHAIRELVRVTKPGGLILIDEQVNYSALACTLFFGLSWLATKLKLNIPAFEVTENTVVGYLTRAELQKFCRQVLPGKYWLANSFKRWPPALHWRLTGLMQNTGSAFIAMRKP